MNSKHLAGVIALAFATLTASAAVAADDHTYGASQTTPPGWIHTVADQKLEAVDGSSLTLSESEGGLAVAVTLPSGDVQKNIYTLMSDKLGTISDAAQGGHLIGFFRATDSGFDAQFADGHTELLSLNSGGGLSVTVTSAAKGSACMAWYPAGHVFSESERRAALAAYAARLGLNDPKAAHIASGCDRPAPAAKTTASHTAPGHRPSPQRSAANSTGLVPVMVRTSIVHSVDGAMSAAVAPNAVASAAPIAAAVIPVSAPQTPPSQTAAAETVQPGHGASDCLSVDNDGANLGFRNQCGFAVQFAYCLQKAQDPAAACDAGSRSGNVAANGFATLLPDTNIKAADAEHDFRWVGCTGGAGEVVAHLDRTDPPAGRCVRTTAS